MKKYLLFSLVALVAISFTRFHPAEAMLGWIGNTTHAPYRIEHTCRDGVKVSVVEKPEFLDFGGDRVGLEPARYYDGTFENSLLNHQNLAVKSDYLEEVAAPLVITVTTTQTTPIDYSPDGSYRYETVIIPFYRELPVGGSVLVNNYGGLSINNFGMIEDCHYFEYSANEPQSFTGKILTAPNLQGIDAAHIQFEIKQLPANGEVRLDGGPPLAVGSRFTLEALQNGGNALDYTPLSHAFEDQRLVATVQGTVRVSNANGHSYAPSISADGSTIAFTSLGTDLSALDTGGYSQIYTYNFDDQTFKPISLRADQAAFGNGGSYTPFIAPNTGQVAFASTATDLVELHASFCFRKVDTNNTSDVFFWQRFPFSSQSKIERRSMFRFEAGPSCVEPTGYSNSPALTDTRVTDDGLVFQTGSKVIATEFEDENNAADILFSDGFYTENIYAVPAVIGEPPVSTLRRQPASDLAPNGGSSRPDISTDGTVIAYSSTATNLLKSKSGSDLDTNGFTDVYVSERRADGWHVSRVSVTSDESQVDGASRNPSVSWDGRFVAFESDGTNLDAKLSNGKSQIYVRDRTAGCTTLVSLRDDQGGAADEHALSPAISGNGRFVAFQSAALELIDGVTNGKINIFVVDRDPDGDGSFYKDVATCVPDQQMIRLVSVATDGTQGDGSSWGADLSHNGDFVAFTSAATNLVPQDQNGKRDVFVHYLGYERPIELIGGPSAVYLPLIVAGD